MRNLLLTSILLITSLSLFTQNYRYDSIVLKDKIKIEAKKTATNIYISTTDKSVIQPSNYFFGSSFEDFLEFNLVETVQESDYIFDCTITGKSEAASTKISIYNSKTGEFVATTGKYSSINWSRVAWGSASYGSKENHFKSSFENCVITAVMPIFSIINGKFNERPITVKGVNDVVNVVVVKSEKYVKGFEKVKDISVRLSVGKSPEDIQEKLEEAMERLRLTASHAYSPLVLITETYGLDGKEKIGFDAVCYKYSK